MKAVKRNRMAALGNSLYDAAKVLDGQRSSSFIAWPMTAEKEFTTYTRETILKKKRMLEANLPIVGNMIKKVGRYSVGAGLHITPETTDAEWNEIVREDFESWAKNSTVCDAMGRWTFYDMQKYAAEQFFGEGECFFAQVNSSQVGSPQLQAFDNFEVRYIGATGAAPGNLEPGEFTYWDGVKLNRNSKVVAYSIQTTDGGGFVDVDAENMIHLHDLKRPNQVRALSPFHAGANSAIDALDLKGLETATKKLHSLLAVVYKKKKGEGVGEGGLSGSLSEIFGTTPEPNGTTPQPNGTEKPTKQTVIGENFFGGAATAHISDGDDIELLTSERQSVNVIDYLQFLYRDVAVSTGLPIEVIWDLSDLGGVNARITLADVQYFFDYIQGKIAELFCRRVFIWWACIKMKNGQLRMPTDPKWYNHIHWQGPAKINIDRNLIAQKIAALDSGLTTLQDEHSAMGGNWKAKQRQRVLEVKARMEMCKAEGVPYNIVFPPKAGAPPQDAPEEFSGSMSSPAPAPQPTARGMYRAMEL
jgi:capsid protein